MDYSKIKLRRMRAIEQEAEDRRRGFMDGLADHAAGVSEYAVADQVFSESKAYSGGYLHGFTGRTESEWERAALPGPEWEG